MTTLVLDRIFIDSVNGFMMHTLMGTRTKEEHALNSMIGRNTILGMIKIYKATDFSRKCLRLQVVFIKAKHH